MLFAILNGNKVEAIPKTQAQCPLCGENVLSKCGEIKVWHWAHVKGGSCDPWYEPETHWHKNWKLTFGKEKSEIKITKKDSWHVADILTEEKVVIELQNSPIQKNVIRKREDFYGERMLWLINGERFKHNFYIKDWDNELNWWVRKHNNSQHLEGKKMFKWEYPRRSWEDSIRHIFIDFHDETLFWVRKGMGTKLGEGIYVSKKEFISKYGGDFEMHLNLFRNYSIKLKQKRYRLVEIEKKNIHLITSIRYKDKPKMLEIYFKDEADIAKIEKLQKVTINGTLKFEEQNNNLQLINSRIAEL